MYVRLRDAAGAKEKMLNLMPIDAKETEAVLSLQQKRSDDATGEVEGTALCAELYFLYPRRTFSAFAEKSRNARGRRFSAPACIIPRQLGSPGLEPGTKRFSGPKWRTRFASLSLMFYVLLRSTVKLQA